MSSPPSRVSRSKRFPPLSAVPFTAPFPRSVFIAPLRGYYRRLSDDYFPSSRQDGPCLDLVIFPPMRLYPLHVFEKRNGSPLTFPGFVYSPALVSLASLCSRGHSVGQKSSRSLSLVFEGNTLSRGLPCHPIALSTTLVLLARLSDHYNARKWPLSSNRGLLYVPVGPSFRKSQLYDQTALGLERRRSLFFRPPQASQFNLRRSFSRTLLDREASFRRQVPSPLATPLSLRVTLFSILALLASSKSSPLRVPRSLDPGWNRFFTGTAFWFFFEELVDALFRFPREVPRAS